MGVSRWDKFRRTGSVGFDLNPLDALRRMRTTGLEIAVPEPQVRRGHEVEVHVTVSDPETLGDIEVGVVCTEFYDEDVHTGDSSPTRTTSEATAHELWTPVEAGAGVHRVNLMVAPHAPFSYEGMCLSFKWEVVARGRRKGLDAKATHTLWVLA